METNKNDMVLSLKFKGYDELRIEGRTEFHIFDIGNEGRDWATIGCYLDNENLAKIEQDALIHVCIFETIGNDEDEINDCVLDLKTKPESITINTIRK